MMMTELPIEFLSHIFITQTLTILLALFIATKINKLISKSTLLGMIGFVALRVQGCSVE